MANGDLTHVKILSRTLLPGGGNTVTGTPVQNKVLVTGEIGVVWANATGIDFSTATGIAPGADFKILGCETLDFIEFALIETDGNVPADEKLFMFQLNRSTSFLYGFEDVGQDTSNGLANGDIARISYVAIGDAHAADLT